jgi:hypothetical protein
VRGISIVLGLLTGVILLINWPKKEDTEYVQLKKEYFGLE